MLRSLIFVKKHKKTLPWMNPICNSAFSYVQSIFI